ncbi:Protein of unknown function, putative, partial [Plasmodium vivax]
GAYSKSLENKHEQYNIENIILCRLLAKHEQKRELRDTSFRDKLPDRSLHKNRRNVSDHTPTYSEVRSKASNNFDIYLKGYKDRYIKKKRLYKLDCYYENKIFEKINHIRVIAEKMHNDKKRCKKIFLKKYGIVLILFALIPAIGIIYPIVFGIDKNNTGIAGICEDSSHIRGSPKEHKPNTGVSCKYSWIYNNADLIKRFGNISYTFLFTSCIIVLSIISYIFIKFRKYEKLKAGKCKMNIK